MHAVIYREWRSLVTYRPVLVAHILSPSLYLLVFGIAMSRSFGQVQFLDRSVPYLTFFAPGLILLQSFGRYGWLTTHASNDRRWSMFRLFMTSHVTPGAYLLGKVIFTLAVVMLQVSAVIGLAALTGNGPASPGAVLWVLLTVVLASVFFSCLGITMGFASTNESQREMLVALSALPFTLLSSAFYDLSRAPVVIRVLSSANPLTWGANAARRAYITGMAPSSAEVVVLVAIACLGMMGALWTIRRTPLVRP
jgi:ABC-2 type transport system permease protein